MTRRAYARALVGGSLAVARRAQIHVLGEAVRNPNSRPRTVDLVRTCTTITTSGPEPRESFVRALRRTSDELGDPW